MSENKDIKNDESENENNAGKSSGIGDSHVPIPDAGGQAAPTKGLGDLDDAMDPEERRKLTEAGPAGAQTSEEEWNPAEIQPKV